MVPARQRPPSYPVVIRRFRCMSSVHVRRTVGNHHPHLPNNKFRLRSSSVLICHNHSVPPIQFSVVVAKHMRYPGVDRQCHHHENKLNHRWLMPVEDLYWISRKKSHYHYCHSHRHYYHRILSFFSWPPWQNLTEGQLPTQDENCSHSYSDSLMSSSSSSSSSKVLISVQRLQQY